MVLRGDAGRMFTRFKPYPSELCKDVNSVARGRGPGIGAGDVAIELWISESGVLCCFKKADVASSAKSGAPGRGTS